MGLFPNDLDRIYERALSYSDICFFLLADALAPVMNLPWEMLGRTMVGPTVRLKLLLWNLQSDFHPSPPRMAVHRKTLEEFVEDMQTTLIRGRLEKDLYDGPSLQVAQDMRAIIVSLQGVYDDLNKNVNNDIEAEAMRDQASSQLKPIVDVIDRCWIQVCQNLPSRRVKLLKYLVEKALYSAND